jgi:hypothetical protein
MKRGWGGWCMYVCNGGDDHQCICVYICVFHFIFLLCFGVFKKV